MDALGHQRFAVVGHDTGIRDRLRAGRGSPGPGRPRGRRRGPRSPGGGAPPPLFVPEPLNDRLWHIPFNRLDKLNEQLVTGREDIFFGYEFAIQGAKKLPDEVVELLRRPALRPRRPARQLRVLPRVRRDRRAERAAQEPAADDARPGDRRSGEPASASASAMKLVADDVQSVVIPGTGHWVAEEAPRRCWRR